MGMFVCVSTLGRDIPGCPVIKTLPSDAGSAGSVFVGELRSLMPHDQKTKHKTETIL